MSNVKQVPDGMILATTVYEDIVFDDGFVFGYPIDTTFESGEFAPDYCFEFGTLLSHGESARAIDEGGWYPYTVTNEHGKGVRDYDNSHAR